MSKEIARFSAEQTARFLAGGELGRPEYADSGVARRMENQRRELRAGWILALEALHASLRQESAQTAARLIELRQAAFAGDPDAARLLTAMLGELLKQALV